MREKIVAISKGENEYELVKLQLSRSELRLVVVAGTEVTESFTIKNVRGTKVKGFLCSEDFMFGDDKEKWAVNELVRKSEELKRLPRKDDFDDATRSRIKAFLGPWPRALEKAGLKTPGGKRKK